MAHYGVLEHGLKEIYGSLAWHQIMHYTQSCYHVQEYRMNPDTAISGVKASKCRREKHELDVSGGKHDRSGARPTPRGRMTTDNKRNGRTFTSMSCRAIHMSLTWRDCRSGRGTPRRREPVRRLRWLKPPLYSLRERICMSCA